MKSRLKKIVSGGSAAAVTAGTLAVLLSSQAAYALGTQMPDAQIVTPAGAPLNSGGSATNFRLKLPADDPATTAVNEAAACTGDSANPPFYSIQSYMVPQSVNPNTVQFDSSGPVNVAGQFRTPLIQSSGPDTGNPYVSAFTAGAVPAGGPGPIIQPLPSFNFAPFPAGNIPAGAYNIGIACTTGPPSVTQLDRYWNTVITVFTTPADSPAQITWAFGAVPFAPGLNTVTPGNGSLTANYTATASTPASTSYTATATPTVGAPVSVTSASPTSTIVTGLTNGTAYSVTVTATNTTGTSAPSNAVPGTPAIPPSPPVTGLTATPGTGSVSLSWTAPADAATRPPTGYTVTNAPAGGTATVTGTTATVTGLTAGTSYTFTVAATYAAAPAGVGATVTATPLASQVLLQNLTVTRPNGALVFTQVCSTNGPIAAEAASPGFPAGLPAVAADGTGFAPTLADLTTPDPQFSQYPYPVDGNGDPNPSYPTNCGVALGTAKLVTSGAGAGQFFSASAVLNQVTVVDTRDTDIGWTANGTMGTFTAGAGKSFSGSQLGWTPVKTSDTAAFTDASGVTYDQTVNAGPVVAPNTPSGMSSGRALGSAVANAGLGIAQLDARLKLLIPVTAKSGVYTGTLTISAV